MLRDSFLSRFTPSLHTPGTLEAVFVQRQRLATRLVELIRQSSETANKHYALVVGPRGIGKTHLVSLVYHRVCRLPDIESKLLIAWLREEEWGVASFLDLLLVILRALDEAYAELALSDRRESLYTLSSGEAERQAEQLLLDAVGNRSLLVIMENLDEVFRGLEETGQRKFRAYIQNYPFFTILATAQSLFNDVYERKFPFYGFFETHHLKALSFDDAVLMVTQIAVQEGNHALAHLLRQPDGRARMRAVHHLAVGNPRVYAIFSQFLTVDSLEQLVEPLIQTLDDLTPYYHSRMSYISPQQRKVVEFLCDRRSAVTVGEIAEHCFLAQATASNQLKRLNELGYVRSEKVGREAYYELQEPLLRLCLEVKKLRGEPIRLFIEFLRLWYSQAELEQRLKALAVDAKAEREYLEQAAKARGQNQTEPSVEACLSDYNSYWRRKEYEAALQVVEELMTIRHNPRDLIAKATCLRLLDYKNEAIKVLEELLEHESQDVWIWLQIGIEFRELGEVKQALHAEDEAVRIAPQNPSAWNNRGVSLHELGREEDAIASFEQALQIEPPDAVEWRGRGLALMNLQRLEEAIQDFDEALKLAPKDTASWRYKVDVFYRLKQYDKSLDALDQLLDLQPSEISYWREKSWILDTLGKYDSALELIDHALRLDNQDASFWASRGVFLYRLGQLEESLESLEQARARDPENSEIWGNRGVALSALGRQEQALLSFDCALEWVQSENFHIVSNRAVTLMLLGQWEGGLGALDKALQCLAEAGNTSDNGEIAIVRNMLVRIQDPGTWRKHFVEWIRLFNRHNLLALLGQGVVRSLGTLRIVWLSATTRQQWRDVWYELGGDYPELQIPLRLLGAGVAFYEAPDRAHRRRVLLRLPSEERSIVAPLLGAASEDSDGELG
ncbi:MAG: hypothetical protein ETSY1_01080 [Candidatus Entotheonella factor]|uniref:HTH arsR-type domain-containing protein n=1 Tax=Entotheonella factor TaxID=1429438 RepID=W4LYG0_ENTF1|nr:tetratricopeptide repeat protein [Candidatus Entotheonella palauensis]ETX03139.1 MAG: hypothetical protein ETSY1_01080 [Candidatus Entotheonella factor]